MNKALARSYQGCTVLTELTNPGIPDLQFSWNGTSWAERGIL